MVPPRSAVTGSAGDPSPDVLARAVVETVRQPLVVRTTPSLDEDISRSYDLGVNSFIRKPVTFEGLVEAVRGLGRYWFEMVEVPPEVREP